MPYTVVLPNVPKDKRIVFPISMGQRLQRGESLKSILNAFKENGYTNVTILICDYLNRFNCNGNEQEAFSQGDSFLEEYQSDLAGFNLVRWKDYIGQHQDLFQRNLERIKKDSPEKSLFYGKMTKTWEKTLQANGQQKEASLSYQREEYAAVLCMNDYDYIFYPMAISPAMAYLYNLYKNEFTIPSYEHIKVTAPSKKKTHVAEVGIFKISIPDKKKQHLHIAFKGLIEQMSLLIKSDELSIDSKLHFAESVETLLLANGLLSDTGSAPDQDLSSTQ